MRILFLFFVQLSLLAIAIVYKSSQPSNHRKHHHHEKHHTDKISYAKDIVPVLSRNCYSCHSTELAAGSLDFTNYDHVYISAISHTLISNEGRLPACYTTCVRNDAARIARHNTFLIKQWIEEGALLN